MEKTKMDASTDARRDPLTTAEAPWLRHYDSAAPHSLEFRQMPLYAWLDEAAEQSGGKKACIFYNTAISFAKMRRLAELCAANLRALGVRPGDRVGIMLPNLPQTMIAFWGVLKAGGVVTMINPLYMEKELLHQIADSGARHLVTLDLCWPKFAKLKKRLDIDKYFVTSIEEGLSFPLNWIQRFRNRRDKSVKPVPFDNKLVFPYSTLLKGGERLSHPVADPKKSLALLQYTSGTTGLSKGAMLTHANVNANIQQIQARLPMVMEGEQTFMAVLPFFHVYGLTTCLALPASIHAKVVIAAGFAPAELLATMEKHKVTALPGAPSMYIALLQQKNKSKYPLKALKLCISGSAPIAVEVIRRFEEEFSTRITEGYGLSESSPITHLTSAEGFRKMGSIGLPLQNTEARIVDMEAGSAPLGPGKVGELVVSGPQVMLGYWNNLDETANILRNGWLYTGDIASMDEEGFFYIVDRKKDMIMVGGYNVAPREIDEVLHEHPKVREAVSVGVAHPSRGEVIKAYVVLKEGEMCERSEIVVWCRERLANYKVPRMVEFRDDLPKTLVGKVLRRALRAEEEERRRKRMAGGGPEADDQEPYFGGALGEHDHRPGEEPGAASGWAAEAAEPASGEWAGPGRQSPTGKGGRK
ncbi:MAG: long-chain fatty acid--CoA ligase [Desulfovibrio sp.]|jgi:long-chain acyl-CoA synthetase|nr:long-chain fatty acid--CoA ligase [Desulfovibrio sp.]